MTPLPWAMVPDVWSHPLVQRAGHGAGVLLMTLLVDAGRRMGEPGPLPAELVDPLRLARQMMLIDDLGKDAAAARAAEWLAQAVGAGVLVEVDGGLWFGPGLWVDRGDVRRKLDADAKRASRARADDVHAVSDDVRTLSDSVRQRPTMSGRDVYRDEMRGEALQARAPAPAPTHAPAREDHPPPTTEGTGEAPRLAEPAAQFAPPPQPAPAPPPTLPPLPDDTEAGWARALGVQRPLTEAQRAPLVAALQAHPPGVVGVAVWRIVQWCERHQKPAQLRWLASRCAEVAGEGLTAGEWGSARERRERSAREGRRVGGRPLAPHGDAPPKPTHHPVAAWQRWPACPRCAGMGCDACVRGAAFGRVPPGGGVVCGACGGDGSDDSGATCQACGGRGYREAPAQARGGPQGREAHPAAPAPAAEPREPPGAPQAAPVSMPRPDEVVRTEAGDVSARWVELLQAVGAGSAPAPEVRGAPARGLADAAAAFAERVVTRARG